MSRGARRALTYTMLLATSAVMVIPFYWMIATSFKPSADVFASPPKWIPDPAILQNYRDVWTLLPFDRYLLNSIIVTGSIVLLNIVFGTMAAYAFAKLRFVGRNAIFFLLLITLMVPFQVNLIPLFRIMVALHSVNPHLGVDTYSALILPGSIQVFGIFLMRQFLQSIPDEVLESARVDGASEFRILWPLIVLNSQSHYTLPLGLAALQTKNTNNWGNIMAGTTVVAVPLILVFLV